MLQNFERAIPVFKTFSLSSYRTFCALNPRRAWRSVLICFIIVATMIGLAFGLSYRQVLAQDSSGTEDAPASQPPQESWTRPVVLSTTTPTSWFPDVAVDNLGRVHVVWDSQYWPEFTDEGGYDVVMYSRREGDVWTEPRDVAEANVRGHITRPSIAVDANGRIHILYTGHGHVLHHIMADTEEAQRVIAWQQSLALAGFGYISDIEIGPDGVIHAVYDTFVPTGVAEEEQPEGQFPEFMADVLYRRSVDGGYTWSGPTYLMPSPKVGSARAQLEIDRRGILHVTWDEGWDRWTLYGDPQHGVYMQSRDNGLSWSSPLILSQPAGDNAQTSVAANGEGQVVLVWRTITSDELFYTWSGDDGLSWSEPITIPGIYSRSWSDTMFDAYDMEADGAGNIHLVAAAQMQRPQSRADCVPLGVYHLMWNKETASWSLPSPVALYECDEEGEQLYPEYPKLDIATGNQLHVVWFVRDDPWRLGNYQIWYSRSKADAPYQVPPPTPSPTPLSTAPPGFGSTPTPTPLSVSISTAPLNLESLYTENDDVLQMLVAVSPILAIAAALFVIKKIRIR